MRRLTRRNCRTRNIGGIWFYARGPRSNTWTTSPDTWSFYEGPRPYMLMRLESGLWLGGRYSSAGKLVATVVGSSMAAALAGLW